MKAQHFIISLFLLLFTACASDNSEQLVTIDDRYSIILPGFLSEASDLNGDASLQYQNLFKEFYAIVIDESKEEVHAVIDDNDLQDYYSKNLDGYTSLLLAGMLNDIETDSISDLEEKVINGFNARKITFSGKTDGVDIFFYFCFIEGKEHYYQVMTWTTTKKRDKYLPKMVKLTESFNEQ